MTAAKKDDGKPRMDLIPPEALMALGEVLGFGARKYADRNWEQGMDWGRFVGAAMRHFVAWQAGEDEDPESGMPHLWHVLTNIAFLTAFEVRGAGNDDRTTYCRTEEVSERDLTVKCGIDNVATAAPLDDWEDEADEKRHRKQFLLGVSQTAIDQQKAHGF